MAMIGIYGCSTPLGEDEEPGWTAYCRIDLFPFRCEAVYRKIKVRATKDRAHRQSCWTMDA